MFFMLREISSRDAATPIDRDYIPYTEPKTSIYCVFQALKTRFLEIG